MQIPESKNVHYDQCLATTNTTPTRRRAGYSLRQTTTTLTHVDVYH